MIQSSGVKERIFESVCKEVVFGNSHVFLNDYQTFGEEFSLAIDGSYAQISYEVSRVGSLERTPEIHFDTSDRVSRMVRVGRLVLCPSSIPLRVSGASSGLSEVLVCRFDSDYFAELTGLRSWREPMLERCGDIHSKAIALAMRRMADELLVPQAHGPLAIEVLLDLVLIDIARLFNPQKLPVPSERNLASWQLRKIEKIFREAADQWPSLTELAMACRISKSHLSRIFSQSTGVSLSEFSERIRMDRARRLLLESNLSIKEIAAQLGFSDANYFSTAFRRVMKMSPLQFVRSQLPRISVQSSH